MRYGIGNSAKSKAEAQRNVDAFKGVVRGVKNYGKNVAGGAKIVGSAVKKRVLKAFKR